MNFKEHVDRKCKFLAVGDTAVDVCSETVFHVNSIPEEFATCAHKEKIGTMCSEKKI